MASSHCHQVGIGVIRISATSFIACWKRASGLGFWFVETRPLIWRAGMEKKAHVHDVFVIDCERWVDADQYDGYPVGSPQLVIEVKSPSNSDDELRHKAALFLADSSLAVWTVDPEKECVTAYRTMNDYQELGLGSLVELPATISIFESARIGVSEIFDGIVQK